jgi:pimeloyl-ACP methyl ester carboxylesterase
MHSIHLILQIGVASCLSSPAPTPPAAKAEPPESVVVQRNVQRTVERAVTTVERRDVRVNRKPGAATPVDPVTFTPCTLTLTDGRTVEAEQGTLSVPQLRNEAGHADREAGGIQVGITRLKGRNATSAAPILYLDGFPQGTAASGILRIPVLFTFFDRLRDAGDVLLMDYRGSGFSTPTVRCVNTQPVDSNLFLDRAHAVAAWTANARSCAAKLRVSTIAPAGYTWLEVAHDVAALRDALSVPKLRLVGFSSGTQAALATLRAHGDVVDRAVLLGTEGTGDSEKLPVMVDEAVAMVGRLIAADARWSAWPPFPALVDSVLRAAERDPITLTVQLPDGRGGRTPLTGRMGKFGLQYLIAKSLSGPSEFATLPRLMAELAQRDYASLQRVMQRRVESNDFNALGYLLDGASGASAAREALVREQSATALLADAANFPVRDVARVLGAARLPNRYREDASSNAAVLFVTGELDGNTPPAQAERVRRGFPNSAHVIVKNAGHGDTVRSADVAAAIAAFLADGSFPASTVTLPAPRFAPPPERR